MNKCPALALAAALSCSVQAHEREPTELETWPAAPLTPANSAHDDGASSPLRLAFRLRAQDRAAQSDHGGKEARLPARRWNLSLHGYAHTVSRDDDADGRSDPLAAIESVLMGVAQRPLAGGTLGLRGILALDPSLLRPGYPLLFQSGAANELSPMMLFTDRVTDGRRWTPHHQKTESPAEQLFWSRGQAWSVKIGKGQSTTAALLAPATPVRRTMTSAGFSREFGDYRWQTTIAWGRSRPHMGPTTKGWLLESVLKRGEHQTFFVRAERVGNDDLLQARQLVRGGTSSVSKVSIGTVYEFTTEGRVKMAVGGVASRYDVPSDMRNIYGARPSSFMVFLRARFD